MFNPQFDEAREMKKERAKVKERREEERAQAAIVWKEQEEDLHLKRIERAQPALDAKKMQGKDAPFKRMEATQTVHLKRHAQMRSTKRRSAQKRI